MFSLGSIASGTVGLALSGLLLFATLAPVPAPAEATAPASVEYATLCTDVLLGITAPCRVPIA